MGTTAPRHAAGTPGFGGPDTASPDIAGTGMDVSQVDSLCDRFEVAARRLGTMDRSLSLSVTTHAWTGADADRFREGHQRSLASLRSAATRLNDACRHLRHQCDQQSSASASGSSYCPIPAAPAQYLGWAVRSSSTFAVDVQVSGDVLAGGGQVEFAITEYFDGTASVSVRGEPELMATFGLGNTAFVGAGGQLIGGATYSFADAASARKFVDGIPRSLIPERDDAVELSLGVLGLLAGSPILATGYVAGEIDEAAKANGGALSSAAVGAGVVIAGSAGKLDRASLASLGFDVDAKIVESYEFDPISGQLAHVISGDAGVAGALFGIDVSGEASALLAIPVGADGAYRLRVRVDGEASDAVLRRFGLPRMSELTGAGTTASVVVDARVDESQMAAAMRDRGAAAGRPMSVADLDEFARSFVDESEVVVTLNAGTHAGVSGESPALDASFGHDDEHAIAAWHRPSGGTFSTIVD